MSNSNASQTVKKSAREDRYQHHDYYLMDELLSEEHLLARDAVRTWVKQEVSPIIEDYSNRAECPTHLFKGLAEIGAFGPSIPAEYGGGGMDEIAYGVIMQELERGDSGLRSMASVQGSLVMYPIYRFGSEEQKRHYLPKLANGTYIGCFGLTEPDHGSNPGGMVTNVVGVYDTERSRQERILIFPNPSNGTSIDTVLGVTVRSAQAIGPPASSTM